MKSAGEWTPDVIILVLMTLYACYASSHIVVMWKLRKNFLMALRSPMLACICGACRIVRSSITVYYVVLDGVSTGGLENLTGGTAASTLIIIPALWVGNGALVAWVVRLLVLYDPRKRKAWGRYVKEARVARTLCWTYVGMEAALWVGAAVYGLKRTALVAKATEAPVVSLVAMASIVLAGRLRKVHDIAGLSRDALYLAVYIIVSFFVTGGILATPGVPEIVRKYWVIFLSTTNFGFVASTINIKPVRQFLRNTDDDDKQNLLSSWILLDRRRGNGGNTSRVACSSPGSYGSARTIQYGLGSSESCVGTGPLAPIMGFLPLKQAFGDYCQKALCSESFQFLVDASEFQSSIHAATSIQEGKDCYEEFVSIINEYIKDNSNSEINIDSRTKTQILRFEGRSSYASLDMEGRSGVFLEAEREIVKMLAENLLSKFKATAEYKEVAGELLFEAK